MPEFLNKERIFVVLASTKERSAPPVILCRLKLKVVLKEDADADLPKDKILKSWTPVTRLASTPHAHSQVFFAGASPKP